jgi:hypothetical protein
MFGLAPAAAKVGDMICILFGSVVEEREDSVVP